MLLRFSVPERDAAVLTTGQDVKFTVASATGELGARIIHIAGSAEGAARLVAVTAEVTGTDAARARPGSFANVSVTVASRGNAPTVPETAVRPSAEGFLAFVVEEGVAKKRVLQIGLRTADGRVEVLEGIKPGETLVTRGGEALSDGVNVQVGGGKPVTGGAK
jgi:multidrug efflux system membrane fusion protein